MPVSGAAARPSPPGEGKREKRRQEEPPPSLQLGATFPARLAAGAGGWAALEPLPGQPGPVPPAGRAWNALKRVSSTRGVGTPTRSPGRARGGHVGTRPLLPGKYRRPWRRGSPTPSVCLPVFTGRGRPSFSAPWALERSRAPAHRNGQPPPLPGQRSRSPARPGAPRKQIFQLFFWRGLVFFSFFLPLRFFSPFFLSPFPAPFLFLSFDSNVVAGDYLHLKYNDSFPCTSLCSSIQPAPEWGAPTPRKSGPQIPGQIHPNSCVAGNIDVGENERFNRF